jgi:prolyl 4-hydroxylase
MAYASFDIASVHRLLKQQRFAEAAGMLIAGADAGHPTACDELAQWRIVGNVVRRDLANARALLRSAWTAGSASSGLLYAAFLASGVGGPSDWLGAVEGLRGLAADHPAAAEQLRLIDAMALTPEGAPAVAIKRRLVSVSPHIELAEALFTPRECAYLLAVGAPIFRRSLVVDPRTGRMMAHPIRKSDGAMIGVHAEDVAINALNRRIATFSRTDPVQGEPLQLLRYGPADEYRAHLDTLPAEPNQRIVTVIVYLSSEYEGGESAFLRAGMKIRGKLGDAILFHNVRSDGEPDAMAEHAGLPVVSGTKHIASRWIRARRFEYPPPKPLIDI